MASACWCCGTPSRSAHGRSCPANQDRDRWVTRAVRAPSRCRWCGTHLVIVVTRGGSLIACPDCDGTVARLDHPAHADPPRPKDPP